MSPGDYSVIVANPSPGGGSSANFVFSVWSLTQQQVSGVVIPYPPSWTATSSSPAAGEGIYISPSQEEGDNSGISVSILPPGTNVIDSSYVLIRQTTMQIGARNWTVVVQQEPDSGQLFYDASITTSGGVFDVGGPDTPQNEAVVNNIISSVNP
jgi:hypothetical protein